MSTPVVATMTQRKNQKKMRSTRRASAGVLDRNKPATKNQSVKATSKCNHAKSDHFATRRVREEKRNRNDSGSSQAKKIVGAEYSPRALSRSF
jgi:electron transfer flavoprotein alpha/beta subunit